MSYPASAAFSSYSQTMSELQSRLIEKCPISNKPDTTNRKRAATTAKSQITTFISSFYSSIFEDRGADKEENDSTVRLGGIALAFLHFSTGTLLGQNNNNNINNVGWSTIFDVSPQKEANKRMWLSTITRVLLQTLLSSDLSFLTPDKATEVLIALMSSLKKKNIDAATSTHVKLDVARFLNHSQQHSISNDVLVPLAVALLEAETGEENSKALLSCSELFV
eukprot:PhM_4_TR3067/c0_g1_i4/m.103322